MAKNKTKGKRTRKQHPGKNTRRFNLQHHELLALAAILAITFICFFPALSADFVNWDDDYNILKNENLKAFRWEDIKGIFSTPVIGNYNPLPIFTFAIEKELFGLNPFVFHLNNILLHLGCTAFIFLIFRRLKLAFWAVVAGTLLFGIHPMRVESVAWITERKDVLFGLFYLWSILEYLKYLYKGRKGRKHFYMALAIAVFAMLAKIQAVALPLSFLAIDYLLGRKLKWNLLIEKIPFFALSLITGLVGIYFLGEQGSFESQASYNFIQRLFIGAHTYGVYVLKFIFPYKMVPLYPYPAEFPVKFYFGILYALAAAGTLYWAYVREMKQLVFGILFFTFNVMFVLQIVGAGQAFLADRFTYIAYIGLFFMLVYYWHQLIEKRPRYKVYAMAGMGIYLALFAGMTFSQTRIWKNSDTLWTHTLKYYDSTPLPFRNRGNYFRDQGKVQEAMDDYDAALDLKADDDGIFNSRGKLFFNQKKYREALQDYNKAIELDNSKGEYWVNRGASKAALGMYQDALQDVTRGLELEPGQASGYLNRSLLYSTTGQNEKAIEDIETYLKIEPTHAELWYEAGRLKRMLKRPKDALPDLNQAIRLKPGMGVFYLERSKTHFELNNRAQARQDMEQARQLGVQIDPAYQRRLNN